MTATSAEGMGTMRSRRRVRAQREVRLILPDARTEEVRTRTAEAVSRLDPEQEAEALSWIEAVSEFHEPPAR